MRSSDIDVVFCHGYGMPRYRGGPMMYGDIVGLSQVVAAMDKYRARYGDLYWTPAPLLAKLAASGQTFAQWSASRG
jgi:3-hydroxyacyl-CoA dehydrogenase